MCAQATCVSVLSSKFLNILLMNESPGLNILFTHPDHRNRGIGGSTVEWGARKADKMRLDAYVEGSYLGRKVYERYGFNVLHIVDTKYENTSPGKDWLRLVEDLQANPCAIMWRSVSENHAEKSPLV